MLQADTLQAGYQPIDWNNPGVASALNEDIRLGNACADALHKCEVEGSAGRQRGAVYLDVQPARQVEGQPGGR
jgi:hypothetical protein